MKFSMTETVFHDDKYILHRVKFGIYITLEVPSIVLSLLIFIFFLTHQHILRIRQNQALLLLLIVNFVQIVLNLPMVIHYNHLGYISPATKAYCIWWEFIEYTLNASGEILMSIISIQRHLLIFHGELFHKRFYRYLLHHIPLSLFGIIYPIVFYFCVILLYTCDGTQLDFTLNACGMTACYLVYSKVLATYDWIVNNGMPIILITFANAILLARVVRQKLRRQRVMPWKKQRRMTIQLLSISSLYFLGWFPSIMIAVVQQLWSPTFLADAQVDYIYDLIYLICLFLPWVCLGLFPEFTNWIRMYVFRRNAAQNIIRPATRAF
ncbi:unnamed protein product [Adineta ricciae]|uniref:G-protein coupled receptors family 1 profile domain-containing protein n=1 Tax=Adineta ricciae TaxID=249248 RepID=A0A816GLT0_ADIRI|nr:unnamed protein product [Adineta ricciae]